MRLLPLLHQVAHLPINTNLLTSCVSVFIRQNILNSSLSWTKSSEANPWYKLYAFQPATVLPNISSFLYLTLCYVSYFLNHLKQIALFFFFQKHSPRGVLSKWCSYKSSKNHRKTPVPESLFLIKLQASGLRSAALLKTKTLAQVFSCELCDTSKNTFFNRTPLVAASGFAPNHLSLKFLNLL